jgi:hypothetical protein
MARRLQGTLAPRQQKTASVRGLDGLSISSNLVGAEALLDSEQLQEIQRYEKHLLRAVATWSYHQRQREACDRARLAIAKRELAQ